MIRYRVYATKMLEPDAPEARVRGMRGIQGAWAKLGMPQTGVSTALTLLDRLRSGEEALVGEHTDRERVEAAVIELQGAGISGEVREIEVEDTEDEEGEDPQRPQDEEELPDPSVQAFQAAMVLLVTTGGPGPAMQTAATLARVVEDVAADTTMDDPESFWVEVMRAILMTFPPGPRRDPLAVLLGGGPGA